MKIACHIKSICKIGVKKLDVGKQSEGPQQMTDTYTRVEAFVLEAM